MIVRPLLPLFLLIPFPAQAADCEGRWVLVAGTTTLMAFEIEQTSEGWTGTWERPTSFKSDGERFFDVSGPPIRDETRDVKIAGETCQLVFDKGGDNFLIRVVGTDNAELGHPVFGAEPAALLREDTGSALGPWDANVTYRRTIVRPTNAEMTAIFEADQAARRFEPGQKIDWAEVTAADQQRRLRVQQLLESGELRSGQDFYHAAYVFQHGEEASDYLKAHALAMVALARGQSEAVWIAAATLDRYLQVSGQSQIYGTQFRNRDGIWSQEPYDRELLPDTLRTASRVPELADQKEQLRKYQVQGNQ